jgi:ATP-dependent Clp protease ATP-binding subunit ClpA
MQILARRRKNNPILLGEPGVGKTAIAEGLALAIVNGKGDDGTELPPFLRGAPLLPTHAAYPQRSRTFAA